MSFFRDKEIKMWVVIVVLLIVILIIWFYSLNHQFSNISSKPSSENYFKQYTNELDQIWRDFKKDIDFLKQEETVLNEEQLRIMEEKIKEYSQDKNSLQ